MVVNALGDIFGDDEKEEGSSSDDINVLLKSARTSDETGITAAILDLTVAFINKKKGSKSKSKKYKEGKHKTSEPSNSTTEDDDENEKILHIINFGKLKFINEAISNSDGCHTLTSSTDYKTI